MNNGSVAGAAPDETTNASGAASAIRGKRRSNADWIDLSKPDNSELVRGAPLWREALWFFLGLPLLRCSLIPFSSFRCWLLRLFGGNVGRGVYAKPGLRVKFPWYLTVGDYSWLGEDLWIDNLDQVTIGSHCCISQGVYLCTGNHDWSSTNMKLFRRPIICKSASWVGAKSILCPGVVVGEGAIVTAGSVVTSDIPALEIHGGNPACFLRERVIRHPESETVR